MTGKADQEKKDINSQLDKLENLSCQAANVMQRIDTMLDSLKDGHPISPVSETDDIYGTNSVSVDISTNLKQNITKIKNDFGNSSDLIINYVNDGKIEKLKYATFYFKSLADKNILNSLALELKSAAYPPDCNKSPDKGLGTLKESLSRVSGIEEGSDYETLYTDLLAGNTVFLLDNCKRFLTVTTNSEAGRAIEEPSSQTVIRGPKDGFTEKILTNILLIRKKIRNKALRVENFSIGNITKTTVCIMYIDQIARTEIVQEIRDRLGKIEIDGILDSGYIEEFIKDDRYSLFPTFFSSERPDTVAANLLEGKVAILVDGTPYVLTAPALMMEFFQASEDYYHHFLAASLMRFFRLIACVLTLLVPATYIAITTFHQEIIPTPLLISIAAQREGVPFPAFFEALLMESTFEILREAGIRMPRAIGSAISIVGALVLGQAAVEAGIISAVIVIVVAITAISSFAIPNYEMSNAIRTIRFVLMIMAGILGLYGVFMSLIILTLHLCKIKSITIPYITPLAPTIKGGNQDTFFRFPLWSMKSRPVGISDTPTKKAGQNQPLSPRKKEQPEFR